MQTIILSLSSYSVIPNSRTTVAFFSMEASITTLLHCHYHRALLCCRRWYGGGGGGVGRIILMKNLKLKKEIQHRHLLLEPERTGWCRAQDEGKFEEYQILWERAWVLSKRTNEKHFYPFSTFSEHNCVGELPWHHDRSGAETAWIHGEYIAWFFIEFILMHGELDLTLHFTFTASTISIGTKLGAWLVAPVAAVGRKHIQQKKASNAILQILQPWLTQSILRGTLTTNQEKVTGTNLCHGENQEVPNHLIAVVLQADFCQALQCSTRILLKIKVLNKEWKGPS